MSYENKGINVWFKRGFRVDGVKLLCDFLQNFHARNICYLPAGRSVLGKTVPEVLKHFQVRGHSFSLHGPTLSR